MNTVLRHSITRNVISVAKKALGTSSVKLGSFKVQDDKDFLEKVENSKDPVIVDFFAK